MFQRGWGVTPTDTYTWYYFYLTTSATLFELRELGLRSFHADYSPRSVFYASHDPWEEARPMWSGRGESVCEGETHKKKRDPCEPVEVSLCVKERPMRRSVWTGKGFYNYSSSLTSFSSLSSSLACHLTGLAKGVLHELTWAAGVH